jgi:CheY-like chemotaxis protein
METMTLQGHVSVVDDSSINRMLLTGILEDAGYDVMPFASGREALDYMRQQPPECVLLDVQMPEMSGFDVCRELKSVARLANIPVIFISALDDVNEKVKGFEAGGVDFVTKPFEPAEVLARVGSQVKLFRLQLELKERNMVLQRRNEQLALAQQRTERMFTAYADALPGTILDETYQLDAKIGEGGFGVVFRATHLRLMRSVAVKVLQPMLSRETDEELMRFRREGIAACRITHPNAVEVLDFGVSSNGVAYLVMELLSGRTVRSLLTDSPTLSVARSAQIVAPVCDALAAAHAAGIVHRDIKPDNVFLHESAKGEVVKVVDFGIAKLMDEVPVPELEGITRQGTLIGTPEYMAPERLLGRDYDTRSDIYSIGVLLYLMLTGKNPFGLEQRANMPEMMKLHLTTTPTPIRSVSSEIPAAVADLVMASLDSDPARRPRVGELGAQLRAAANAG